MAKFEAHITMPRAQADIVQQHAELLGMTFSAIDGDPVMGKQAYCYLTAYAPDGMELLAKVHAASRVLAQSGVEILREKVERIMFDSKTSVDELTVLPPSLAPAEADPREPMDIHPFLFTLEWLRECGNEEVADFIVSLQAEILRLRALSAPAVSPPAEKCLKQINTGTGSMNCQLWEGHGGYCSPHPITLFPPAEKSRQLKQLEIDVADALTCFSRWKATADAALDADTIAALIDLTATWKRYRHAPSLPASSRRSAVEQWWVVLEEHSGLWWGPQSGGYTDLLRAGLYTESQAKRIANNPSRRDRAFPLADKLREIAALEHSSERVLAVLREERS